MLRLEYEPNEIVSHNDLCIKTKCGCMGGIRYSKDTNSILLFMKEDGSYSNFWEGDVLHYMGSGNGDQELLRGRNRALTNSEKNNSSVYLFERIDEKRCRFIGQMKFAKKPTYKTVKNKFGEDERKVVYYLMKCK